MVSEQYFYSNVLHFLLYILSLNQGLIIFVRLIKMIKLLGDLTDTRSQMNFLTLI